MTSRDYQENTSELESLEMEHLPSLGKEFRDQRESRNLAIEQVAIDLHIDKRYLKAIEDDDFAQIGKRVFIRGYICNYARYLDLNQELVLEMLAPHLDRIDTQSNKPKFLDKNIGGIEYLDYTKAQLNLNSDSQGGRSAPVSFWVGLVLLGFIVSGGLLGYVFISSDETPSQFTEVAPPEQFDPESHSANTANTDNTDAIVEVAALPVTPEPLLLQSHTATSEETKVSGDATNANKNEEEQIAIEPARQSVATQALVAEGANELLFQITSENWIEVRRADGSVILSRLFRRNDAPLLRVALPVDVIIGNASSASLTLNGFNINFDGDINNNVARLRLPR